MNLEQIIASTCRQKILLVLSKVRKAHITYNQIRRNIEIMEKEGIITIQHCGNMKIIQLDLGNTKTQKLLKALQALRTSNRFVSMPKLSEKNDLEHANDMDS